MHLDTVSFEFDTNHFTTIPEQQIQSGAMDYNGEHLLNETLFTNISAPSYTTLTESQSELVEKFNAAFVEAQHGPKPTSACFAHQDIIDNIAKIFSGDEAYGPEAYDNDQFFLEGVKHFDSFEHSNDDTNFLLDIFMAKSAASPAHTLHNDTESCSASHSSGDGAGQHANYFNLSSETRRNFGFVYDNDEGLKDRSVFYITPPLKQFTAPGEHVQGEHEPAQYESFDDLGLSDIDFCDNLSTSSFDIETITTELCDTENFAFDYENACMANERTVEPQQKTTPLPSVTTFGRHFSEKKFVELDNFMRNCPANTINLFAPEPAQKNACGHLLGNKPTNNNLSVVFEPAADNNNRPNSNQVVLTQTEAILHDDPLLSSSSVIFPKRLVANTVPADSYSSTQDNSDAEADESCALLFQCKWEQCYELYPDQKSLVRHIEKSHVELKKGEEFSCFWLNCPRKSKPFNARYKLLIHMRVHSGEKPNKCPFKGCNKAFSRLENLKIHQRSHTGERPYLCQFSQCAKSFSNSSDRAKHQRTHYDTKPYACQISGCQKRYTDPSSLRKHVKNHTLSEQAQLKRRQQMNRDASKEQSRVPGAEDTGAEEHASQTREFRKFSISTYSGAQQPGAGHFQKLHFNAATHLPSVVKHEQQFNEHSYSTATCAQAFEAFVSKDAMLKNVKLDLKNKISEKHRQKRLNQLCQGGSY